LVLVGLVVVICSQAVASRVSAQAVVVPVVTEDPEHLSEGGQYFDPNLSGLRDYLDSIRSSDPELYATLDPALASAESDRTWAHVMLWGVGVGGGLSVLGLGLLLHDDCDNGDFEITEAEDECMSSADTQDAAFLVAAGGVFATGIVTGLLLLPGRPTFLRLLNQHNRLRPSSPLRLSASASQHHFAGHLSLRF
jgi:hypothetical protein